MSRIKIRIRISKDDKATVIVCSVLSYDFAVNIVVTATSVHETAV